MHFTATLIAAMATLGFAVADPSFRFSEYGNSDNTCNPDNLISPSVSIDDSFGSCNQFPVGTNSVQYKLLEGSRAGCTVKLYTNNACNGPAISEYTPAVGEQKCQPPLGGGWQSVQVTCP